MEVLKFALTRRTGVAFATALLLACVPDVDIDESLVNTPRIAAVRALPAEAAPGEPVQYEVLVLAPDGEARGFDSLELAYCTQRAAPSENAAVSRACTERGEGLVAIDAATPETLVMPTDACARFGPDLPPVEGDAPPGRPADADVTGGYRQPLVIRAKSNNVDEVHTFEHRVRCALAGALPEDSLRYRRDYRNNTNPRIESIRLRDTSGAELGSVACDGTEAEVSVPVGTPVTLEVAWPACPNQPVCGDSVCLPAELAAECPEDCTTPLGCEGSELYLRFDTSTREFVEEREAMRVRWFSTSEGLRFERTGVASEDAAETTNSTNTFVLPSGVDAAQIWTVVRDSRGGTGWCELRVIAQ